MSPIQPQPLLSTEFKPLSALRRGLLIVIGTITLILGIVGAFVPGMPSTVFFLVTLGCYARSSDRLYRWLLTRRWLKKPMASALSFKKSNAIPVGIKVLAQTAAWSSVTLLVFTGRNIIAQVIGVAFALACTLAMAMIKSMPDPRPLPRWTFGARDILKQLGYGALAGMAGGAVWGLGARVIMRFVANLAGKPPLLNIGPTLQLIVATAVLGVLIGLAYAGLRRGLPKNQWIHGIAFGFFVCFTLGTVLYVNPYMRADLLRVGAEYTSLIVGLFIPNFIALGLVTSLIFGQLERRVTRPAQG